eukprot:m.693110 g.693110  ORF g.693110 m.693110 type:complete len:229 (+) comp58655_c0_seq8:506-1192(+)
MRGRSDCCGRVCVDRWVPYSERSRLVALTAAGQTFGAMIANLASPLVARSWQLSFYVSGCIGILWVAVSNWYATSEPESHPSISAHERAHILSTRNGQRTSCSSSMEEASSARLRRLDGKQYVALALAPTDDSEDCAQAVSSADGTVSAAGKENALVEDEDADRAEGAAGEASRRWSEMEILEPGDGACQVVPLTSEAGVSALVDVEPLPVWYGTGACACVHVVADSS